MTSKRQRVDDRVRGAVVGRMSRDVEEHMTTFLTVDEMLAWDATSKAHRITSFRCPRLVLRRAPCPRVLAWLRAAGSLAPRSVVLARDELPRGTLGTVMAALGHGHGHVEALSLTRAAYEEWCEAPAWRQDDALRRLSVSAADEFVISQWRPFPPWTMATRLEALHLPQSLVFAREQWTLLQTVLRACAAHLTSLHVSVRATGAVRVLFDALPKLRELRLATDVDAFPLPALPAGFEALDLELLGDTDDNDGCFKLDPASMRACAQTMRRLVLHPRMRVWSGDLPALPVMLPALTYVQLDILTLKGVLRDCPYEVRGQRTVEHPEHDVAWLLRTLTPVWCNATHIAIGGLLLPTSTSTSTTDRVSGDHDAALAAYLATHRHVARAPWRYGHFIDSKRPRPLHAQALAALLDTSRTPTPWSAIGLVGADATTTNAVACARQLRHLETLSVTARNTACVDGDAILAALPTSGSSLVRLDLTNASASNAALAALASRSCMATLESIWLFGTAVDVDAPVVLALIGAARRLERLHVGGSVLGHGTNASDEHRRITAACSSHDRLSDLHVWTPSLRINWSSPGKSGISTLLLRTVRGRV